MGRLSRKETIWLKKLGFKIRKKRQEMGWTLEEAEERAVLNGWKTCSWKHLQKIETGQKDITATTIFKLAQLFRIKLDELFPR